MDALKRNYRNLRIQHWNRVAEHKEIPDRIGAFYQRLLSHYYNFLIPSGLKVLELGCGSGDLLSSLSPSFGLGIDFSFEMILRARKKHPNCVFIQADVHDLVIKEKFDVIILSDLINDLFDLQSVLENIHHLCHARTRIIINFYNNIWRIPLSAVKLFGLGADLMEQNWFTPHDVINLLELSGYETINIRQKILFPLRFGILSKLCNKYLVNISPFKWFALTNVLIARPRLASVEVNANPSVSVVVAARNEEGNIEEIFRRMPDFGSESELIIVEGHSSDHTYEAVQNTMARYPEIECRLYRQKGKGKGDAIRLGFEEAKGDILMILDADLTVPPEILPRFYQAIVLNRGEFINGVRLVYPMENKAMRFFNIAGNKFFSWAFSWLLEQPIKDTLCGTKVLWKKEYNQIVANRNYFGDFDPFGDFDLLFGAARLNLKIAEMPVRYRARTYGDTNISRWRHGWLLLRMVVFAAQRIKFI